MISKSLVQLQKRKKKIETKKNKLNYVLSLQFQH